jgi:hypothetical protein
VPDLMPDKRGDRFVCQLGLIFQNQSTRVWNLRPLDMRICGERFPGILEGDFVKAVCGIGKELLIETRYEGQQWHGELGELPE